MFDSVSKPQPSRATAFLPALLVLLLAVGGFAGLYAAAELGHLGPAGMRSGMKVLGFLTVGAVALAAKRT